MLDPALRTKISKYTKYLIMYKNINLMFKMLHSGFAMRIGLECGFILKDDISRNAVCFFAKLY